MAEFLAGSGAKVVVNIAPWGDALALKNSVMRELKAIDLEKLLDAKEDFSISKLLTLAVGIDSSEEVQGNVMRCLQRSSYAGEKITDATFESEKAREDYYEVVIKCLEVNLSPFFKGLASRLNGIASLFSKNTNTPK